MIDELKQFDFQSRDSLVVGGGFFLNIPVGIESRDQLFSTFYCNGRFPGYFGFNWDALLDCLSDFSWIGDYTINVVHEDLPLSRDSSACYTYLEILREAVVGWKTYREQLDAKAEYESHVNMHELKVFFPLDIQMTVYRLITMAK